MNAQPEKSLQETEWEAFLALGLSAETLAKSWKMPVDDLTALLSGRPNPDGEFFAVDPVTHMRDIAGPFGQILAAPQVALDPASVAYWLMKALVTGENGAGFPQLSLESCAKLSGIDADKLKKFAETPNNNALSETEAYRLCVALLIVDRALNYKSQKPLVVFRATGDGGKTERVVVE